MNIDPDIDHTKNPLTQGNIFDVNARRPVNQDTPFDKRLKISEMLGNKEAEELLQAKIKNEQIIKADKMREKLHSNPNKEARIKKIKQIRAQTAQKAQAEKAKFFYEPNTEIASTIQYMTKHHNATGVWCVLHPTLLQYSIIGKFIETITVRALKDYDTVGVPQNFLKFRYNDKPRLFTEEEINKLPIEYKEETEETEEITKFGEIYTHMQQMEYGEWNTKNDLSIESYFFEVSSANYTIVNNCIAIQNAIIQYNAVSDANMPQSGKAWLKGLYNNLYDNVMLFQQKYRNSRKTILELIKLAETMKENIKNFILKNKILTSESEISEYNRQFDSNFDGHYGNMFKKFRDSYIKYYDTHGANNAEETYKRSTGNTTSGTILLMQKDFNERTTQNIKNDYKYKEHWISEGDARAAAAPAPVQVSAAAGPAGPWGSIVPSVFKLSGGKRKSKRKQRRSRKQKKSRKQRR